jgi:transcriptional regulator with XRE-family HTH domain
MRMKKAPTQPNRVKELREAREISGRQLAKTLGISGAQMSRLESGKSPLSIKWITEIAQVLGVSADEIMDLPFDRKFTAKCDAALLGSVIGWLMTAAEKSKIKLTPKELSKWASYVYDSAVSENLNFKQTRLLASTVIKAKKS